MIETISFQDKIYPSFQSQGFAAQFAFPFALKVCQGVGFDIGCNRKEWALPDSIPIDPAMRECEWDAMKLPPFMVDFIFSSHCLEHIPNWVDVLNYWTERLKPGGVLFLYLPHYSQKYWRPWHNRKHCNIFTPKIIGDYLLDKGYKNIFSSGRDLNNSFMIMAEK